MRKDFEENKYFGGIVSSSSVIINSEAFSHYELIMIDSSQNNPIPSLFIRLIKAIKRIILLLHKLIMFRPDASLIFAAGEQAHLKRNNDYLMRYLNQRL